MPTLLSVIIRNYATHCSRLASPQESGATCASEPHTVPHTVPHTIHPQKQCWVLQPLVISHHINLGKDSAQQLLAAVATVLMVKIQAFFYHNKSSTGQCRTQNSPQTMSAYYEAQFLKRSNSLFLIMNVYLCMWGAGAWRGRKHQTLQELEFWVVVRRPTWVLGTELLFSKGSYMPLAWKKEKKRVSTEGNKLWTPDYI